MSESDEDSVFNAKRANLLVGKSVLIGLTYIDANGDVEKQSQMFGHIASFEPDIVTIKLTSGDDFTLPPALEAFEEAEPGEYRLRSTGEVIVNPDLISTWTVNAPTSNVDEDEGET
jgi:hypothetical protein